MRPVSGYFEMVALGGPLVGALNAVDADLLGILGGVSGDGAGEGDVVAGLNGLRAFAGAGQLDPNPVGVGGADPEPLVGGCWSWLARWRWSRTRWRWSWYREDGSAGGLPDLPVPGGQEAMAAEARSSRSSSGQRRCCAGSRDTGGADRAAVARLLRSRGER